VEPNSLTTTEGGPALSCAVPSPPHTSSGVQQGEMPQLADPVQTCSFKSRSFHVRRRAEGEFSVGFPEKENTLTIK